MPATINADNGVVSGSAGVKTTADTSGVLALQSNGQTGLTLGTNLVTTLAQPLPVGSGGTGATSLSGITVGTATSATNLAGGAASQIPYQTGSGATAFIANGTTGQVLTSNGTSAPSWSTPAPGAGTVTAIASGSLADGTKVIVNSDGTVSAIVASTPENATTLIPQTNATTLTSRNSYPPATYDPATNTVVCFFIRQSNDFLLASAGTISGSTITFGDPIDVFSASLGGSLNDIGFGAVYVPNVNRHVVVFSRPSDGFTVVRMVQTFGNSAQLLGASEVVFESGTFYNPKAIYDPVSNRVIVYATTANNQWANVIEVNSNSFNVGTRTNVGMTHPDWQPATALALDTVNNKVIFGASKANGSNFPGVVVGTVSGLSISFGSPVIIQSTATPSNANLNFALGYSPVDQKVFVAYAIASPSTQRGAVGTVSGNSISFGTSQQMDNGASSVGYTVLFYEPLQKLAAISSGNWSVITLSGTTFSEQNTGAFSGANNRAINIGNRDAVLVYGRGGTGIPVVEVDTRFASTLNSNNFLGISNGAYTNGQTATIQTVGSTDDAQSGLTPGLKYYVSPSGGLGTNPAQPYAGLALSATRLVIKG